MDNNMEEDMRSGRERAAMQEEAGAAAKASGGHVLFRICALVSLICAAGGWLLFYFEPVTAVALGCGGICAAVCGIFSGRGCLRSVAITSLVASGVLVLVYAAFYWGLAWGVRNL